jgi:uncharacterized protein RhaS with RHS repeats
MQQRYYDPVIGRFYSNDPVDFMGHMQRGNSAMGFNRYAYANNNPYKYTDPDGEFANFAIGAAIGALTEIGTQFATDGKVSSWTKVGVSAGVGAVSGGLNVVAKGAGVVQAAVNTAMNETVSATAAATGSVIADGLEGNVSGSFERAGVAALESVAGPGKAAVSAVKGKIGGIAEAVGMKTPSANTGIKALDSAINNGGAALLKTAEGVAGNSINNEIKENNK